MTYRIKPLVWEKDKRAEWADTPLGILSVYDNGPNSHWSSRDKLCRAASLEDGKAAAEAHYQSKLLEALEPVEGT